MSSANYNIVGQYYARFRQADPRIASLVQTELPKGASIINIGAGTGSYEPSDHALVAVDPSAIMLAQRRGKHASMVRAVAEQLPFQDNSFDLARIILSLHHWDDWRLGLREAMRVARSRIVLFTWVDVTHEFWLYDYFPELEHIDKDLFGLISSVNGRLNGIRLSMV